MRPPLSFTVDNLLSALAAPWTVGLARGVWYLLSAPSDHEHATPTVRKLALNHRFGLSEADWHHLCSLAGLLQGDEHSAPTFARDAALNKRLREHSSDAWHVETMRCYIPGTWAGSNKLRCAPPSWTLCLDC